jgi:hypothetical protein
MDLTYNQLVRAAAIGMQIEADFIVNPAGPTAIILHRAKRESADALAALVTVDPEDAKEILRLQNLVNRYRDILRFVSEALNEGKEAEARLETQDVEEISKVLGIIQEEET